MKRALMWTMVLGLALVFGGCASSRHPLVEQVAKGCDQEITAFCKEVTPGEGVFSPVCTLTRTSSQASASMRSMTRWPSLSGRLPL